MPLKVFKRKFKDKVSKTYWIRGTVAGREIFESTGTTILALAEKYRISREAELIQEALDGPTVLFIDALNSYEEAGGETTYNDKLIEALGEYDLNDINQELIDQKARETYPTQSNASVKRWFYDPVVAIMRHAAKRGMCHLILIEKPTVKRPPAKWAEPEWFEAFWPYCSPELRALSILMLYTGCRVSEALSIEWEMVRFKEETIFIPDTKNGEPRSLYLRDVVIETLLAIKPEDATGRVFPWGKKDAANQAIRRAVGKANKDLVSKGLKPIPYLSSHKIGSHTYATWMRRYAKMDQRGLVGTGRWKSIDSTMIYTHTIASEEARKSDLLPVPLSRAKAVQPPRKRRS